MPKLGDRQSHCKRGHERTADNVNSSGGCIICQYACARKLGKTEKYREYHREYNKRWAKDNPDKVLNTRLKQYYGITIQQYEDQLVKQEGKCPICLVVLTDRREFGADRPVVDHRHDADKTVRGILCSNCNCGIGLLKDSSDVLLRAVDYLRAA